MYTDTHTHGLKVEHNCREEVIDVHQGDQYEKKIAVDKITELNVYFCNILYLAI